MAGKSEGLVHVGFMVPLRELMLENKALADQVGHLDLRCNIYTAVLFYRDTNQDSMEGWYQQRKRSARRGYLRAYYLGKQGDAVIQMDVDGKPLYLIASAHTMKSPIQMKTDIGQGKMGERQEFPERIEVACFPYKFENDTGFTECDAFAEFKKDHEQKMKSIANAVTDSV
jgi:hypothetical protein